MTIPNGTRIAFGSPAWGAINTWQIRWQWLTGLTANFNLHYTDANNLLAVTVTGTALNIFHTIAGTAHNQAGSAIALTNSNVYWLKRSEEHTSELQSHSDIVCRLLLGKKKKKQSSEMSATCPL